MKTFTLFSAKLIKNSAGSKTQQVSSISTIKDQKLSANLQLEKQEL